MKVLLLMVKDKAKELKHFFNGGSYEGDWINDK